LGNPSNKIKENSELQIPKLLISFALPKVKIVEKSILTTYQITMKWVKRKNNKAAKSYMPKSSKQTRFQAHWANPREMTKLRWNFDK